MRQCEPRLVRLDSEHLGCPTAPLNPSPSYDKTKTLAIPPSVCSVFSFNGVAAEADKPLKLAVLANSASDFWTYVKAGCEKAMKEVPNVSVEVRLVPDGTPAEQTRIFDDLLVKGSDGIAISPIDSAEPGSHD